MKSTKKLEEKNTTTSVTQFCKDKNDSDKAVIKLIRSKETFEPLKALLTILDEIIKEAQKAKEDKEKENQISGQVNESLNNIQGYARQIQSCLSFKNSKYPFVLLDEFYCENNDNYAYYFSQLKLQVNALLGNSLRKKRINNLLLEFALIFFGFIIGSLACSGIGMCSLIGAIIGGLIGGGVIYSRSRFFKKRDKDPEIYILSRDVPRPELATVSARGTSTFLSQTPPSYKKLKELTGNLGSVYSGIVFILK